MLLSIRVGMQHEIQEEIDIRIPYGTQIWIDIKNNILYKWISIILKNSLSKDKKIAKKEGIPFKGKKRHLLKSR